MAKGRDDINNYASNDDGLLPTLRLSANEFEDFTERLLRAHRFSTVDPRVVQVERWGRPGDKQDGIDLAGRWSDGRNTAWQCKRYKRFTAAQVHAAVAKCTFPADAYYLVLSCEASPQVREAAKEHPGWTVVDRRDIGGLLNELPLHQQRDVLDATWGSDARKRYLRVPSEDVFLSLRTFRSFRRDQSLLVNDLATLRGRDDELQQLTAALGDSESSSSVVVVSGPGGRGKTRLAIEALTLHEQEHLTVPIICLAEGRAVGEPAFAEIPAGRCIVLIDDAHQHPNQLPALLSIARQNADMKLVLTARDNGIDRVLAMAVEAGFAREKLEAISLGELTRPASRRLVGDLTEGLQLHPGLIAYLDSEATHSPHIAVIMTSLARKGALTGALAINPHLRQQILARYQDVLIGDSGSDSPLIKQFVAVAAALGDVAADDSEMWERIAAFCGAPLRDILRVRGALRGRGVLRETQGAVRVVPELLAEQALETEAVIDGVDSGFVGRLWSDFGGIGKTELAITIAELDWRLTHRGLPPVVQHVWSSIADEVDSSSMAGLVRLIPKLAPLARTQPQRLIDLLDTIRSRARQLDGQVAEQNRSREAATDDADPESLDAIVRRMTGQPPLSAIDVDRAVPAAYAQCGVTDQSLIDRVLDVLWQLGLDDRRPQPQTLTHAHRVLAERFLTIGDLPSGDTPRRVVGWVRARLSHEPDHPDSAEEAALLGLLNPLLAKAGARTELSSSRSLRFHPFTVELGWARALRDEIRALLRDTRRRSLRTDAVIVELLTSALRPPVGAYGAEISDGEILKWESDDLATLQDLAALAAATDSGVLRRHIRAKVSWTAEFSRTAELRARAFRLLWELDQRNDDLEDLLLNETLLGPSSQRGKPLPDRASFAAAIEPERVNDEHGLSDRVDRHIRDVEERASTRVPDLIAKLASSGNAETALNTIQRAADQVLELGTRQSPFLWELARGVAQQSDDCVRTVLAAIHERSPSVLDEALGTMLRFWAVHSKDAFLDWAGGMASRRRELREAVGQALANRQPIGNDPRLTALRSAGLGDAEACVREAFLRAEHLTMAERPAETIALLNRLNASVGTCRFVLNEATRADPEGWGARLNSVDAEAVLAFLGPVEWSDWVVGQILIGIARSHPRQTLEHLTRQAAAGLNLPLEVEGLTSAFEAREVASWIVGAVVRGDWLNEAAVLGVIASDGMSEELAASLLLEIGTLDSVQIVGLSKAIGEIPMWLSARPLLAEAIAARAETLNVTDEVIAEFGHGAHPNHWSGSNGVSPELETAHCAAIKAGGVVTNPRLQALLADAVTQIEASQRELQRRDADDDWEDA